MKIKSEVFETFKISKAMVENNFNKKIKSVRSDGGGEYVKSDFQNFCESEGIRMEHLVPYTPQQHITKRDGNMPSPWKASTSFSLG